MDGDFMRKHAYLILAHNEFGFLKKLLEALDYEYNDIYIHIDKKAKNFNEEKIIKNIKKSKVYFIERKKIQWGGYSIVNVELKLLEAAVKNEYAYYHLLSGVDYPLTSQEMIHKFFGEQDKKEFIMIKEYGDNAKIFHYRIKYYHFFQEKLGKGNEKNIYYFMNKVSLKIQTMLNVDRQKKQNWVYQKGSQWFSITNECAKYLVKNKMLINKQFRYTSCADEIAIQTVLWNSNFKDKITNKVIRYEVWEKWAAGPRILEKEDYTSMKESNALFARKFSDLKSKELLQKINQNIKEREV